MDNIGQTSGEHDSTEQLLTRLLLGGESLFNGFGDGRPHAKRTESGGRTPMGIVYGWSWSGRDGSGRWTSGGGFTAV